MAFHVRILAPESPVDRRLRPLPPAIAGGTFACRCSLKTSLPSTWHGLGLLRRRRCGWRWSLWDLPLPMREVKPGMNTLHWWEKWKGTGVVQVPVAVDTHCLFRWRRLTYPWLFVVNGFLPAFHPADCQSPVATRHWATMLLAALTYTRTKSTTHQSLTNLVGDRHTCGSVKGWATYKQGYSVKYLLFLIKKYILHVYATYIYIYTKILL